MKKKTILFIGVSLIVGIILGFLFGKQTTNSNDFYKSEISRINNQSSQYQNSIQTEQGKSNCLAKVTEGVKDGMNWCLGYNMFCVTSGGDATTGNLGNCRNCLWRAYNYGAVEKNKCLWNTNDSGFASSPYNGAFGICDFGWGINGNILKLSLSESAKICNQ